MSCLLSVFSRPLFSSSSALSEYLSVPSRPLRVKCFECLTPLKGVVLDAIDLQEGSADSWGTSSFTIPP